MLMMTREPDRWVFARGIDILPWQAVFVVADAEHIGNSIKPAASVLHERSMRRSRIASKGADWIVPRASSTNTSVPASGSRSHKTSTQWPSS
jgi:hypothetical protein